MALKDQRLMSTLILTLMRPTTSSQTFSPIMPLTMMTMTSSAGSLAVGQGKEALVTVKMAEREALVALEVVSFQDHRCLITKISLKVDLVLVEALAVLENQ